MSRSRAKGTTWESAIVAYLQTVGWPDAERRALNSNKDRGDIVLPRVCIEAKSAARIELAEWLKEAEQEQANAGAEVGAVWFKRRGKTSAGAGYVLMSGDQFTHLLRKAGYSQTGPHDIVKVDEWAPGQKRLWCACGTRCLDADGWTAKEIHRIHVESQPTPP